LAREDRGSLGDPPELRGPAMSFRVKGDTTRSLGAHQQVGQETADALIHDIQDSVYSVLHGQSSVWKFGWASRTREMNTSNQSQCIFPALEIDADPYSSGDILFMLAQVEGEHWWSKKLALLDRTLQPVTSLAFLMVDTPLRKLRYFSCIGFGR
jgi:hypothetical protein